VAEVAFLSVNLDTFRAGDGEEFERVVIRHPGAVAIVPILDDQVVLVRQFRAPIGTTLLEIPAGKLDVEGEPPELAAARECEEETGYRPGRLEYLRTIHTAPGFTDEQIHLYLALDLVHVGSSPVGVEERHAEVLAMSFDEVQKGIAVGSISDAKTLIGLHDALARHFRV